MGFFIRKSIRLGPLRFNLSKSGIGVSAGVPGFRLSTGPRGNYVNIGKGGIYYRKTLPSLGSLRGGHATSQSPRHEEPTDGSAGPLDSMASADVSRMVDSTSSVLLAELQRKRQRWRMWPFAMVAAVALMIALYAAGVGFWFLGAAWVILFCALAWVFYRDLANRSVVVMYNLDRPVADAYGRVHTALDGLARCGAVWHVGGVRGGRDTKYHGGASQALERRAIMIRDQDPPSVRTNVPIGRVSLGALDLYLCPDTILVYSADGIGSLGYDDLHLEVATTRVIEDGSLPRDAKTVDRTWRYTNKDGSPDRRFKDNREIPICEYEEIRFRSDSGLDELLQVSHVGPAAELAGAVRGLAAALASARQATVSGVEQQPTAHSGDSVPALSTQAPRAQPPVAPSVAEPKPLPAPATVSVMEPKPLPVPVSQDEEYELLFRLLCCVMVIDELATTREKNLIGELMQQAGATWEPLTTQQRIRDFIDEVQHKGFKPVLQVCLARVPVFKTSGHEDLLLKSLDTLVDADGKTGEREKQLLAKIQHLLGRTPPPLPVAANVKA